MPEYNFTGLTRRQKEVLTAGGWRIGMKSVQPSRATVQKLLDRGLLVERRAADRRGFPTIIVSEYHVPIEVFQAWADYCALRRSGKVRVGATSV